MRVCLVARALAQLIGDAHARLNLLREAEPQEVAGIAARLVDGRAALQRAQCGQPPLPSTCCESSSRFSSSPMFSDARVAVATSSWTKSE